MAASPESGMWKDSARMGVLHPYGEIKDECVFQQHLKPEESVDDYIEPQMPSITPISLDIYSTMADFEEGLREAADMIKELRTK